MYIFVYFNLYVLGNRQEDKKVHELQGTVTKCKALSSSLHLPGRPRHKWKDNNKINPNNTKCVGCIHVAHDKDQWGLL
jgi:hypothetical protein